MKAAALFILQTSSFILAFRSHDWFGRSPMLLIACTPQQNDA